MPVFKTYMKVVKKNLLMALIYTGIFVMLVFMFSSGIVEQLLTNVVFQIYTKL